MSMGTIARSMKRTRTSMIERQADDVAADFQHRFGMRDGDYIEFTRNTSHGPQIRLGRIMSVECCYYNQRGGYTAEVSIVPLLADGRLGKSMGVWMTVNANGTGLKGLGRDVVRRYQLADSE